MKIPLSKAVHFQKLTIYHSFYSTKKFFFFFQDEPIESDNLGAYLKKEKKVHPDAAQSTAAYASHSGKGLLFFVKNESQKAQPIGIIKLVSFMLHL